MAEALYLLVARCQVAGLYRSAHELAGQLEEHAERHALACSNEWALLCQRVLAVRAGRAGPEQARQCVAWRADAVQGDHRATCLDAVAGGAVVRRCCRIDYISHFFTSRV